MCGRIAQSEPSRYAQRLEALWPEGASWRPSWNIGPMASLLGVRLVDGRRVLSPFGWGLLPGWASDPKQAARCFNARAETAATKPTYRHAFATRRLLVPVDGFYEWAPAGEAGRKQPYFFSRADGEPLVLAGLWEHWARHGEERTTASVLTAAAGPDMTIHDRQPVVLEPEVWERWLDPAASAEGLAPLLHPAGGVLRRHRVGAEVGSVRNDGPHLVAAVDAAV